MTLGLRVVDADAADAPRTPGRVVAAASVVLGRRAVAFGPAPAREAANRDAAVPGRVAAERETGDTLAGASVEGRSSSSIASGSGSGSGSAA